MKTAANILTKHIDKKSMDEISVNIWPDMVSALHEYAIEKVKEALQLAADNAHVIFHDGTTKGESSRVRVNIGNNHVKPNRALILSLLPELVETINKEI